MDYRKVAEDALRERAGIFEQRKALAESDRTEAEKREGFERMDADMDRLAAEAREAVTAGEREAEVRSLTERAGSLALPTPDRRSDDADEFNDSLRAVARGDVRSFDFSASQRAFSGDALGLVETVSDGTGDNKAGIAGKVTPDTFVATLLQSLEDSSDVLARVKKISTSSGEVMNWPRRIGKVSGTFKHVLEAAKYPSVVDGDFSLFPLSAHKFGAIAEIPEEALTDPALNIGALVAQEMGEDLAESLAAEVLTNPNGTLTQGILEALTITNTLPEFKGDATDIAVYDALIDMQHSLRQKYRRNASWTISDDTERRVRKIKDAENNYIWQPAVVAGAPDMLLGKPVSVEFLMPEAPSGVGNVATVALYGDLGRYYVLRNVRAVSVTRSNEYGFDRDTVALKIKWRGDGGVTDPQALAGGSITASA